MEGQKYPHQHQKLERVLGPTENAGSAMSQWVLTINGEVMPIQTLRRLTSSEMNSDAMKRHMEQYDAQIKK